MREKNELVLQKFAQKIPGGRVTPLAIAKKLNGTGICICPDFFSLRQLNTTRDDLNSIHKSGAFKTAGTGHGIGKDTGGRIRRDEIHWLDRDTQNSAQALLWRKVDSLKVAFNRTLFLGLQNFEGHYAVYPKDGFYARHLDCFRDEGDRVISFILYLNQNWRESDGGRLRIHGEHGAHTDVDPEGGTMVCFMSADSEHEVLLNHAPRFSFSGWFKTS
ncbi:MAG: 2OG-Fe(II) oxygenase [Bdellovibrionales bacterium]